MFVKKPSLYSQLPPLKRLGRKDRGKTVTNARLPKVVTNWGGNRPK